MSFDVIIEPADRCGATFYLTLERFLPHAFQYRFIYIAVEFCTVACIVAAFKNMHFRFF